MRDPVDHQENAISTILAPRIGRLKRRADFLRAAKGGRWHETALSVQAAPNDAAGVRIGYTLTRKVGSAVVRNRARRRLKEAVRLASDLPVAIDHDYVVVGRIEAVRLPFAALQQMLAGALRKASARHSATRSKRTRPAT